MLLRVFFRLVKHIMERHILLGMKLYVFVSVTLGWMSVSNSAILPHSQTAHSSMCMQEQNAETTAKPILNRLIKYIY
jgi:hypothetical protein